MKSYEKIGVKIENAQLNTEIAIHIIKIQTLKNEIEDLKIENKKLKKVIENLEDEGMVV